MHYLIDCEGKIIYYSRIVICLKPAHDVAQFLQVGCGKVIVVAVTALHIFVYPVKVEGDCVQQLDLHKRNIAVTTSLSVKSLAMSFLLTEEM